FFRADLTQVKDIAGTLAEPRSVGRGICPRVTVTITVGVHWKSWRRPSRPPALKPPPPINCWQKDSPPWPTRPRIQFPWMGGRASRRPDSGDARHRHEILPVEVEVARFEVGDLHQLGPVDDGD